MTIPLQFCSPAIHSNTHTSGIDNDAMMLARSSALCALSHVTSGHYEKTFSVYSRGLFGTLYLYTYFSNFGDLYYVKICIFSLCYLLDSAALECIYDLAHCVKYRSAELLRCTLFSYVVFCTIEISFCTRFTKSAIMC